METGRMIAETERDAAAVDVLGTGKSLAEFSRTPRSFLLSAVVAAALVTAIGSVASLENAPSFHAEMLAPWLAGGVFAGVVEELVFRWGLFAVFLAGFELRCVKRPALAAATLASVLFALLHVLSAEGFVVPQSSIEWVQCAVKPLQAFLFGMTMAALYARTGSILAPIVVHVLYDLACFTPLMLLAGVEVTTHATGLLPDALSLCLTVPILAFPLRDLCGSRRLDAVECVSTVRKR